MAITISDTDLLEALFLPTAIKSHHLSALLNIFDHPSTTLLQAQAIQDATP